MGNAASETQKNNDGIVIHAGRKARERHPTGRERGEREKSCPLLKQELLQDGPTFTPVPHSKTFKK